MNTTSETIALPDLAAALGVTIETSAPSAGVDPKQGKEGREWPHIAYSVTLKRNGRDIWKGQYKLGIGHVKEFPRRLSIFDWQRLDPAYQSGMKYDGSAEARIAASLAKTQKATPRLPDVLHSLLMEGSPYFQGASFEEWADDFGYDTDSRSAEKTYAACMDTGRQISRAFTAEELAQLQEAAAEF